MRFGKLAAGLPAALLVGVLVHVAAAGFEHAPGGRTAGPLAVGLTLALLGSLTLSFGRGLVGTAFHSIATPRQLAYTIVALGLAGTAAYGAIELVEGHVGAGGVLRAFAASFPVAALVHGLLRRARTAASDAGIRVGSYLRDRGAGRRPQPRFLARPKTRSSTRNRRDGRPHAGRAPPLFDASARSHRAMRRAHSRNSKRNIHHDETVLCGMCRRVVRDARRSGGRGHHGPRPRHDHPRR